MSEKKTDGDDALDAGQPLAGAISSLVGDGPGRSSHPSVNPKAEEAFWRENFHSRLYVRPDHHWSQFDRAFRIGWEARRVSPQANWEDIEPQLARQWEELQDSNKLPWERAILAARDAWHRLVSWFDDHEEDCYWREHFAVRPYALGESYDAFRAAYRFGWEAKRRCAKQKWSEVEQRLEGEWKALYLDHRLPWKRARAPIRDAWQRVEDALPRDRSAPPA